MSSGSSKAAPQFSFENPRSLLWRPPKQTPPSNRNCQAGPISASQVGSDGPYSQPNGPAFLKMPARGLAPWQQPEPLCCDRRLQHMMHCPCLVHTLWKGAAPYFLSVGTPRPPMASTSPHLPGNMKCFLQCPAVHGQRRLPTHASK